MTSRLFAVTLDCADAAELGGFWAQALGRELDPGAGNEFASIGLRDSGQAEPRWCFAHVPEGKSAKNRMHPDLITGDLEAEVERRRSIRKARIRNPHEHNQREDSEGGAVEEVERLERAQVMGESDDEARNRRAAAETKVACDPEERDRGGAVLR